ncbi:hypothetical protein [Paramicrobacterium agarici]|uniref:Uncharacterized protein n=1 Tax=Paramicrobacterium agarici TaxID=630514 RepID=A0A2A9DY21_9MICO|nr:hypothetical protein [Microbacterium agarici]PFG31578.1 hypothetical protein ATJ78_2551 [Microbacterium agarici]TQO21495.1 hypothetical protein FB385_0300 [Microbacterium agarici]
MPTADSARERYRQWPALALGIVFGLFYAYDLWEAVGNVLTLAGVASQLGIALSGAAWLVLIVSMILPIAIFIVAILLGRSRGYLVQAVFYVCGLAVSAATYLSLVSAISFA